jgi:hypothetical protein
MPSRTDERLLASLDEFEAALEEVMQAADGVRVVARSFKASLQDGRSVTDSLQHSLPSPNLPRLVLFR